jgi:WxL domain surface cell wall-binding
MKKQILVLAFTALMVMMSVVPALAQGEVEVIGGSLSISAAPISITDVTLTGVAQNNIAGTTTPWTAKDPTGTGAGWNLTIAATDFTNAESKTIAVTGFEVTLLDSAILLVDGNTKPTSSRTTASALGAAQKLVSADVDTGMGTYTLQPTFTLDVPAATYAGEYTSTVTLQMVSAP